MNRRGEVLVAIMNDRLDFAFARDQHWYRIPVSSVDRFLRDAWPPGWLAFYQTRAFETNAHAVCFYARVRQIRKKTRAELLPGRSGRENRDKVYYKLEIDELQRLRRPIFSRRWRRIIFIPTTWQKLHTATEINDLYAGSPLEDRLWAIFKRHRIEAERQEFVRVNKRGYFLDFAIYCLRGGLDVETDGDSWHADPRKIPEDNRRNNDLESAGWKVLRFNTLQISEKMETDCWPTIVRTINQLGGVEAGEDRARRIDPGEPGGSFQRGLFDV